MATTPKQDALRVLDGLPEDAALEDIQHHLYVLQRVTRGRDDVDHIAGDSPGYAAAFVGRVRDRARSDASSQARRQTAI